jgi:hypothetical protein
MLKLRDKIFSHRKLFVGLNIGLGILAVVIPPSLVVYHNWLMHPAFHDIYYKAWKATPFLKELSLPTYFLIIFPLFIISIYIFVLLALMFKSSLPEGAISTAGSEKPSMDIPKWQIITSTCLSLIAGLSLIADLAICIIWQKIAGIEILGIALLYILSLLLKDTRLVDIKLAAQKHAGWVIAFAAIYTVVLVLLQRLFGEKGHQLGFGVIPIILIALIMIRSYRKIPVILWISLAALILYIWGIDSWRLSAIGDEHDFYRFGAYILTNPLSEIGRNIFNAMGVFGTHTYLVSLAQAVFMKLFGTSNFGWRISNPVLLSAAVVCFYLFFRKFTKQSTALVICGLLACSGYLMNFGKIGYDNPQAFFMLGLTLWLAAEAVSSRRPVIYAILGLAMGFCLYSYPAALYVLPLPVILMAIFDFPKTRPAKWRWAWWISIFCILTMPLLFQPSYVQGKIEGLYFNNLDAMAHLGIGFMFSSQLVYSLFSYLYVINGSHFVVSSHVDPVSAVWIPIGLSWLAVQFKKNKFALFWMISFVIMLFLVGASHGRLFPPNTRMFMLLPWWLSFAAFGIDWLAEWIRRKTNSDLYYKVTLAAMAGLILVMNLVQVNWVFPRLHAGTSSLEVMFMRLAERGDDDPAKASPVYLFVTDESWGIDGLRILQDLYHSPQ